MSDATQTDPNPAFAPLPEPQDLRAGEALMRWLEQSGAAGDLVQMPGLGTPVRLARLTGGGAETAANFATYWAALGADDRRLRRGAAADAVKAKAALLAEAEALVQGVAPRVVQREDIALISHLLQRGAAAELEGGVSTIRIASALPLRDLAALLAQGLDRALALRLVMAPEQAMAALAFAEIVNAALGGQALDVVAEAEGPYALSYGAPDAEGFEAARRVAPARAAIVVLADADLDAAAALICDGICRSGAGPVVLAAEAVYEPLLDLLRLYVDRLVVGDDLRDGRADLIRCSDAAREALVAAYQTEGGQVLGAGDVPVLAHDVFGASYSETECISRSLAVVDSFRSPQEAVELLRRLPDLGRVSVMGEASADAFALARDLAQDRRVFAVAINGDAGLRPMPWPDLCPQNHVQRISAGGQVVPRLDASRVTSHLPATDFACGAAFEAAWSAARAACEGKAKIDAAGLCLRVVQGGETVLACLPDDIATEDLATLSAAVLGAGHALILAGGGDVARALVAAVGLPDAFVAVEAGEDAISDALRSHAVSRLWIGAAGDAAGLRRLAQLSGIAWGSLPRSAQIALGDVARECEITLPLLGKGGAAAAAY